MTLRKIFMQHGHAVVYSSRNDLLSVPMNGWNEASSTNRRLEYEDCVKAGRFVYEDEIHLIREKANGGGSYITKEARHRKAQERKASDIQVDEASI